MGPRTVGASKKCWNMVGFISQYDYEVKGIRIGTAARIPVEASANNAIMRLKFPCASTIPLLQQINISTLVPLEDHSSCVASWPGRLFLSYYCYAVDVVPVRWVEGFGFAFGHVRIAQ